MKQIAVILGLALAASPAFAADAIIEQPPEPIAEAPVLMPFTWTGPYAGIQGGAGWLKGDFNTIGFSDSHTFNGGILGGFAGYNYQFDNNVVVGVEGDLNYNWNDENIAPGVRAGTDLDGSIRGRLGYAMDRFLVYGTAGWTIARGYVDVPGAGKDKQSFNGYTVGAGVEYAFKDNIFGRAEYRFNDYGSETVNGVDVDAKQHKILFGIGVKF